MFKRIVIGILLCCFNIAMADDSAMADLQGISNDKVNQCLGKPDHKYKFHHSRYYLYNLPYCEISFIFHHHQLIDIRRHDQMGHKVSVKDCPIPHYQCLKQA